MSGSFGIRFVTAATAASSLGTADIWAVSSVSFVRKPLLACSWLADCAPRLETLCFWGEIARNQPAATMSSSATTVPAAHCWIRVMSALSRLGAAQRLGCEGDRGAEGHPGLWGGPRGCTGSRNEGLCRRREVRVDEAAFLRRVVEPRRDIVMCQRLARERDT